MRPVDPRFPVVQPFGAMPTAGVAPSTVPDTPGWYVAKYGNYQPFGHSGMDIACPIGTPVYAMAPGTVLWADWGTKLPGDNSWGPGGYFRRWALYKNFPGICTVIQHPWGIGVYAHKSEAWMNVGDTITEGQQIGRSGNTGGVAPHLHVEALIDLSYRTGGGIIYGRTNPEPYFGTLTTQESLEDDMTPEQAQQLAYIASPQFKADIFTGKENVERDARNAFHKEALNTDIPWFGYDGKQPAEGRTTTTPAVSAGYADTIAVSLHGAIAGLAEIVKQLSVQQGVTIDYAAIAKAVNDDAAQRMKQ